MMSSALAAPITCATQLFELKEHRTFEWRKLFTNGLLGRKVQYVDVSTCKVPSSGVGRCANAMFLSRRRPIRNNSNQTP